MSNALFSSDLPSPDLRGESGFFDALMRGFFIVFFACSSVDAAENPSADLAFFETHIRPALIEHCYECHSEEEEKRKGGLWLDRRSGWETGGDSGPAILPGDPEASLLIKTLHYQDPDLEMPPEGKLPKDLVAKFEEWIRRGAADPRTGETQTESEEIDIAAGRQFWSFQPITHPAAPPVANTDWPKGDIDHFILARLEAEKLAPAPDADRSVLLRRLTIALTGLPSTVEEQDAFLSDQSPDALEKVVDRLLATDAFAERWGRHWLDITRYADTSGGGRAMALPDAWRFRDYVIDSFRHDKPIDQMIREHIAGDLLPAKNEDQRMDQLIATGYLVLGPHNYENQDKELLELEIIDEQIDTLGRSFLGMTLGCARCHDHKFDPIPTRDYYAMAGIFTSTQSVKHANVSQWQTQPYRPSPEEAAAFAAYEKQAQPLKEEIDDLRKEIARLKLNAGIGDQDHPNVKELNGLAKDDTTAEFVGEWMTSSSNQRWVGEGYQHDMTTGKGEKSATYHFEITDPDRYEVRVSWSPGSNRATNVPFTIHHAEGKTTVLVNQRQSPKADGLFHSLGFYRFEEGAASVVIGTADTDGVVIADAVQLLPESGKTPPALTKKELNAEEAKRKKDVALAGELQTNLDSLLAELKKVEKTKPKLSTVMAVADADQPADTPIRLRGMVRNFGEIAPRGFLEVALPADQAPPVIESDHSGRLELANWIASPENPLTARVMANRIWHHLVGQGIVRDPDNFGTTGEAPSHPELLDHLATRLIDLDWSARSLIREIVLSRTWSMDSESTNPKAASIDPENHLFWKAPRQKLDAETLRDSLLALGGNLDSVGGGPSLPEGFKSEFGFQFTSLKRTVYIPVFRNQMHEILSAFDFANPNFVVGKRSSSSIPTQSLYMMNSPFVHDQAEFTAEQLLADTSESIDDSARVSLAYRRVLGREPSDEERRLSLEFIRTEGSGPEAFAALIRTLFSCVDFQYLR